VLLLIFFFPLVRASTQSSLPPIGMWKEYLPYNSAIDVAAGDNKIYCATPYSLFSVDLTDHSIERRSRITGLAETGVNAICYDESSQKLLIGYTNSNIDILYRNDIYRANFYPASVVHQKDKSNRKPAFGSGLGHNRFVVGENIVH